MNGLLASSRSGFKALHFIGTTLRKKDIDNWFSGLDVGKYPRVVFVEKVFDTVDYEVLLQKFVH